LYGFFPQERKKGSDLEGRGKREIVTVETRETGRTVAKRPGADHEGSRRHGKSVHGRSEHPRKRGPPAEKGPQSARKIAEGRCESDHLQKGESTKKDHEDPAEFRRRPIAQNKTTASLWQGKVNQSHLSVRWPQEVKR